MADFQKDPRVAEVIDVGVKTTDDSTAYAHPAIAGASTCPDRYSKRKTEC